MWGMILAWLLKPRNLVIVAVAVVLFCLGGSMLYYKNKAKNLEAELNKTKEALQLAKIELEELKKNIDKRIGEIRDESRKREEAIRKKYEGQEIKLGGQIIEKDDLIKKLDSQLQTSGAEREKIKKEMEKATGEHQAALQEKGRKLEEVMIQLEKLRSGLVCLDKNVPNNMISTLNEVLTK